MLYKINNFLQYFGKKRILISNFTKNFNFNKKNNT